MRVFPPFEVCERGAGYEEDEAYRRADRVRVEAGGDEHLTP